MFLVAFVTLALSIVGLFAQIVSVQSAQEAGAQTVLADTMEVWHGVAVKQALLNPPSNLSTAGCSLTTPVAGQSSLTACATASEATIAVGTSSSLATAATLPPGYNQTYSFNSMVVPVPAFTGGPSINYVVTYAAPGSNGLLTTAGGAIGYSASDLLHQLSNLDRQNVNYGTVQSNVLTVVSPGTGTVYAYNMPSTIPNGSVAIISAAE